MPRVKVPRVYKATLKVWGSLPSNPHAPAKTIAVRKFTSTHGAIVQQKAGSGVSQAQDCRARKTAVRGHSIRAFATDRTQSFAAMPYLMAMRRGLHVERSSLPPAAPSLPGMPAPSFAAQPVWGMCGHADDEPPLVRKQAAVRRALAKLPLYAFAQLEPGTRGSVNAARSSARSSASNAPACRGAVGAKEREALKWFGSLSERSRAPSGGGVKKVSSANGRAAKAVSRPARLRL